MAKYYPLRAPVEATLIGTVYHCIRADGTLFTCPAPLFEASYKLADPPSDAQIKRSLRTFYLALDRTTRNQILAALDIPQSLSTANEVVDQIIARNLTDHFLETASLV